MDFSWVDQNEIVIIHSPIINWDSNLKESYLQIVHDIIGIQISWIKKGNKCKIVRFLFDVNDREYIKSYFATEYA